MPMFSWCCIKQAMISLRKWRSVCEICHLIPAICILYILCMSIHFCLVCTSQPSHDVYEHVLMYNIAYSLFCSSYAIRMGKPHFCLLMRLDIQTLWSFFWPVIITLWTPKMMWVYCLYHLLCARLIYNKSKSYAWLSAFLCVMLCNILLRTWWRMDVLTPVSITILCLYVSSRYIDTYYVYIPYRNRSTSRP